jgi:Zn-dependent peptidase ImmA (M78 family)
MGIELKDKEMTVGEEIRIKRIREGRSQRELSALLGLKDHSMLAKIESGIRFPRNSIGIFAEWLGISEDDLVSRLAQEKAKRSLIDLKTEIRPTFLPLDRIESIADKDRRKYLGLTKSNRVNITEDRENIAQKLFGLRVIYTDYLFGPSGDMLYGGLFPQGCYYHHVDKVIVICNQRVKGGGFTSEETKTFQLFHEMGHYRLHLDEDIGLAPVKLPPDKPVYCSSGGPYKPLEFQANAYASAFLLPETELREAIGNRRIIDLDEYEAELRSRFGVSRRMLLQRLKRIGIEVMQK